VLTLLTLFGICCKSPRLLLLVFVCYTLLLLLQIIGTALLCYWVHSLDEMTNDSLSTLNGGGGGVHSDAFLGFALAEAEAFTCRTYQTCCRDPNLDSISSSKATCLDAHEGTSTDITIAFQDVSSANFCPYVSGGRFNLNPPSQVCELIEGALEDFSLSSCRSDFCLFGIDGYFDFVQKVADLLRKYSYFILAGFALWVLGQLTISVNVWNLRRRYRKEQREKHKAEKDAAEGVKV